VAPWRSIGPPAVPKNGAATVSDTTTPPSGRYPLVTPLANVIMSGRTSSQRSIPNQVPRRPKPQITLSMTSRMPCSAHRSATPSM
jgi:hypothetical protein